MTSRSSILPRFVLAAWLVVLAATAPAPAQSVNPIKPADAQLEKTKSRVLEKLTALKAQANYPGVSVGFVLEDGRTGAIAVGLADVEAKLPLKTTDRLLAGSIGKTYVAAVMLQLIEEGNVGLDDKLEKWLGNTSWFSRLPNAKELTIHNLMTHSSGLREYFEISGVNKKLLADPDRVWKPEELVAFILDTKPLFAADKGWAYADTNYVLVGLVIEKATGKPLFDEITRRLLRPLKLE